MKPAITTVLALTAVIGAALLGIGLARPSSARSSSASHWAENAVSAHPNALWHIVHDLCVTDMKASGHPAPCAFVDLSRGYAVVKDIQGATQYLLIPTTRVTGIESPSLLASSSPNYWQDAWSARSLFEAHVGHAVPREDIALTVNSVAGRTQNQLHIHIDCIRPDVRAVLATRLGQIGPRWSSLTVGPANRRYRVRWLAGESLGAHDPFKLLARSDPAARAAMDLETLAVVGAAQPNGAPGFIVLADRGDGTWRHRAAGEELQDHKCAVLSGG